jgi:hypothetical protein
MGWGRGCSRTPCRSWGHDRCARSGERCACPLCTLWEKMRMPLCTLWGKMRMTVAQTRWHPYPSEPTPPHSPHHISLPALLRCAALVCLESSSSWWRLPWRARSGKPDGRDFLLRIQEACCGVMRCVLKCCLSPRCGHAPATFAVS